MRKVWQVTAGSWLALPLAVQSGLAASGVGRSFTRKGGRCTPALRVMWLRWMTKAQPQQGEGTFKSLALQGMRPVRQRKNHGRDLVYGVHEVAK